MSHGCLAWLLSFLCFSGVDASKTKLPITYEIVDRLVVVDEHRR